MRFIDAVHAYEVAACAIATRETVAFPLARRFAGEVRRMGRAIEPFEDDQLWGAFIRRSRRTLRELSLTPLSPSHPAFELSESIALLAALAERARGSYPDDVVARADLCVNSLADVIREETNPLGNLIAEILNTGALKESGLVVKTRHLDAVRSWLGTAARGVRLVTEREIADVSGLESLVVVGPGCWFPPHIISAPRAEIICFVHYDFLLDREHENRLFAGSHGSPGTRIRLSAPAQPAASDDEMEAALLVPTVDWDALARASGTQRRGADDVDAVPANLFLLADGYSVFLEATDGPTIDVVVNLESGSQPKLRSERTRAIAQGDFIVLRSEGGSGDYIPGIADARLGRRASLLRASQAQWKEALRKKVREHGFPRVERELRALGVPSPNLRYRLWKNSLRSRDPNDFRILMEYIGLADRAAEIWIAMGDIFEAHIRAGQDVRKLLENAVLAADSEQLIQTGRVDVRLTEMSAGTLSVLRVEGRAPEPTSVDEDELRVMIRVEPDLWQG